MTGELFVNVIDATPALLVSVDGSYLNSPFGLAARLRCSVGVAFVLGGTLLELVFVALVFVGLVAFVVEVVVVLLELPQAASATATATASAGSVAARSTRLGGLKPGRDGLFVAVARAWLGDRRLLGTRQAYNGSHRCGSAGPDPERR
jgi:hypothetical protein